MAIPKDRVFAMLREAHAETRFRERFGDMVIKLKGKTKFLGLQEEYKIREVRYLVAQLDIPLEIAKKNVPEI